MFFNLKLRRNALILNTIEMIFILVGLLSFASLLGLLVGFILVLSKKEQSKKDGIQILQYSVIGLIIGFGACAVLLNG